MATNINRNWDENHVGKAKGKVFTLVTGFSITSSASLLGAGAWKAVSDPALRAMIDLRGITTIKVLCMLGGNAPATKLRVQYHTGGNPNMLDGDPGWKTLGDSPGNHPTATLFEYAIPVPEEARIENCLIRVGLYDGDGLASPTINMCRLRF